jgi:hypothetical protein
METWMPINGYEGVYEVSDKGDVKSLARKIILKPSEKSIYPQVNLSKGGSYKTFKIHRLVAGAFIENHYNLEQVNHIDGNKKNNNVANLEWVTRSDNVIHAYKIGLMKKPKGELNGNSKLKETDISQIIELYNDKSWTSSEIAKSYDVSRVHVERIIRNKSWIKKERFYN